MQNRSPTKGALPLKQTLFIILLTTIYLLCEMAFNARLLDVAGSLEADAVVDLEHYGRLLSGTAVALFVLQWLLGKRARSLVHRPHVLSMVFWCLLSVALTYGALKLVVDLLVHSTSSQFRKASVNLVLVRAEMLKGNAQLAGLGDDPALFQKPEGKAFAALFPSFGALIWPQMDKSLAPVKLQLLQKSVSTSIGGPEALYNDAYTRAIRMVSSGHRGDFPFSVVEPLAQAEANKAWDQYVLDLRARGWTPRTIPVYARGRVVAEMSRRVGVPRHWKPDDRQGFDSYVFHATQARLKRNPGTVYDGDRVIASGLGFPAYVAHPLIQKQLQDRLELPAHVPVLPAYASAEDFEQKLYVPVVREQAKKELARLELPAEQYMQPGKQADAGFKAAQAVLVPPIALWFSLLGAITHLGKLMYLLTRLAMLWVPGMAQLRFLTIAVPLAVMASIGAWISFSDTRATLSSAHQFLRKQAIAAADAGDSYLQTRLLLGAMHAVEVGQSHAYPLNNAIRTRLLGNFKFDHEPATQKNSDPNIRSQP